jgi:WD40 repeat protein
VPSYEQTTQTDEIADDVSDAETSTAGSPAGNREAALTPSAELGFGFAPSAFGGAPVASLSQLLAAPFRYAPVVGSDKGDEMAALSAVVGPIPAAAALSSFVAKAVLSAAPAMDARGSGGGGARAEYYASIEGDAGARLAGASDVSPARVGRTAATSSGLVHRVTFRDAARHGTHLVTAVAFQPGAADTIAAAYSADVDHDGANAGLAPSVVHLWDAARSQYGSAALVTTAAATLQAPQSVSTLAFHPTRPGLLYGGTFGGRVLLWDLRAGARPVATSFPGVDGHSGMLSGMAVVMATATDGAAAAMGSAASLLTYADGHMCSWPADRPAMPIGDVALAAPASHGGKSVYGIGPSVVDYCTTSDRIIVGAVDGSVLYGSLRAAAAATGQFELRRAGDGSVHAASVTSVACRSGSTASSSPASPQAPVLASASLDCTVRVWGGATAAPTVLDGFAAAVYDCRWVPNRAALLATADGTGRVAVWDVSPSAAHAAPVAATSPFTVHRSMTSGGGTADATATAPTVIANRLAWDSHGRYLAVGASNGDVALLSCVLAGSSADQ